MPGYETKTEAVLIAGKPYLMCVLLDHQQHGLDAGEAEAAGVSSSTWPHFGQLWPAGTVLAEHMAQYAFAGKRMLEIGCGMALSSLVLHDRGADITASDHHPLAADFLARNAKLNALSPIKYVDAHWDRPDANLGWFDVILASDVLYERGHADSIATFIERHTGPIAEIFIADPGRGHGPRLRRLLNAQNFLCDDLRQAFSATDVAPYRGSIFHFHRGLQDALA